MNEYAIETKQPTKAYGSLLALNHVNLHIKKGSIYGLIGDNGAGKSNTSGLSRMGIRRGGGI